MKVILPSRLSALARLGRTLAGKAYETARFVIVVDENTYGHCLVPLVTSVQRLQEAELLEVPVGEECKDLAIAQQLWESLLEGGADRDTVIVNLGGGCVSDLGGFVAAGYKRGIRYINIPTTLVGMIDAAIGGKTAVNLAGSKNQVGFFHQPEVVCIEPAFLDTLPADEMKGGLCEMLKTLLIGDPDGYESLRGMIAGGNVELPDNLISTCVEVKSAIVKADPYDKGIRKVLNLGHTFGHAIEAYSHCEGQLPLSHGLAVGIGMVAAFYLSVQKLGLAQEVLTAYRQALRQLVALPRYTLRDTENLLAFMRKDKKNAGGDIRCVLLQAPGAPVIDLAVDENEIRTALLVISE